MKFSGKITILIACIAMLMTACQKEDMPAPAGTTHQQGTNLRSGDGSGSGTTGSGSVCGHEGGVSSDSTGIVGGGDDDHDGSGIVSGGDDDHDGDAVVSGGDGDRDGGNVANGDGSNGNGSGERKADPNKNQ